MPISIANWMPKVDTLEFLKLWEQINNINFKPIDFEGVVNGSSSIVIILESNHLYLIQTIVNCIVPRYQS